VLEATAQVLVHVIDVITSKLPWAEVTIQKQLAQKVDVHIVFVRAAYTDV
jgi:hypothetical protein